MADNDDKPTADEVDEVELEDARGGTARCWASQDSAEASLEASEDPDQAKTIPVMAEDPPRGD